MKTALLLLVSAAVFNSNAEIVTRVILGSSQTNVITVASNQVFRVVNAGVLINGSSLATSGGTFFVWSFSFGSVNFDANTMAYFDGGGTNGQPRYAPQNMPSQLAGPFTLTLNNSFGNSVLLTYEILTTTPQVQIANTVVIPEDSNGPVQIILEQSTDLISWTAANPGSYGATTQKRFFRLRAIKP